MDMTREGTGMNSLFDLTGKVAVVTGGVGILGKNFCRALAQHGADVAVIDLFQDAADEFAEELSEAYRVRSRGFSCNIADPESVRSTISSIVATFGAIHVLHNNAATKGSDLLKMFAPFEEYTLETWNEIMSVNINGMFLMAQAVGKQMVEQGVGGSIIQTSSIYGIMAPDNRIYEGSEYMGVRINTPAVYSASKAAVVGFTKWLASYYAPHNIRVNTLTPGGNESGQNETFIKNYSNRIPLGRMGQPNEMVGALVYLASEASSYVTGQNIIVDGGLSAW